MRYIIMASDNYVNTRLGPDIDRINVNSATSFFSDSTFCETEFENLDVPPTYHNDQYKDYTHLSRDANSVQNAAFYDNDGIGINMGITSVMKTTRIEGKDQFINSRSQHSVLYANDDMLRMERENAAPPIPRRKNRARKIANRMSTIRTSVWKEVHEWPRLKTATVSIVSIVLGAGLCIGCYLAYRFIDDLLSSEENSCKVLEELKNCSRFIHNDKMEPFVKFTAKCSKIHKKYIKGQTYIIYEDKVTFDKAIDFCLRVANLTMVPNKESECKNLNSQIIDLDTDAGYWTGQWYRYDETNKTIGSYHEVKPKGNNELLTDDRCIYIQIKRYNEDVTCYRDSNCDEEKHPICKC